MKPLTYGCLQVTDDLDDDEVRQRELGLEKLADAEGLRLGTIYYEDVPIRQDAVNDLRWELKRTQAHNVVTPSLDHPSRYRSLQERMAKPLECGANARVWIVEL